MIGTLNEANEFAFLRSKRISNKKHKVPLKKKERRRNESDQRTTESNNLSTCRLPCIIFQYIGYTINNHQDIVS